MPTIQKKVTLAANTVNDNILTGSQFEFLPFNAHILFGFNQSATGLVLDVYSGMDTVAEAFEPAIAAAYPVYPDAFTLEDVAAAGERLKVRVRNTTGGSLDIYMSARINPV